VSEQVQLKVTRDVNHPDNVIILKKEGENFRLQFGMRWQDALEFARVIVAQARLAEEYSKANHQIAQEALLIRATGGQLSMVTDPRMREAARTEAAFGDARKRMPLALGAPTVSSARRVGTLTITKQRTKP
jgi:hypothetical protein